ncbi:Rv3654c family TadE-like protein [Agrococcus jejuensis]|uniref:Rv3654c family TadE-like protein n=1 Tax=Agrococcus jejuensis TaxID=399736 RepID=UPI00164344D9|nr:Rv3654c family TadE-like protein [Agrococcus jejuensis]
MSAAGLADDRGAGAVLALAIVAAAVVAGSVTLGACGLVVASARVDAAADAAALSAADAAAGWSSDDPCTRAGTVAAANGASVVACSLEGLTATIVVADAGGLPVRGTAVAGPPDARADDA